jgi:hypothetical protein
MGEGLSGDEIKVGMGVIPLILRQGFDQVQPMAQDRLLILSHREVERSLEMLCEVEART